MSNAFSKFVKDNKIFRDERYLYPEFVPETLPHRDSEIDEIAFALQPVLKGGKPQNIFVSGVSGTGKTVTVKSVLRQLEEFSDRAKSVYLNCFEFKTRYSILSKITNFLGHPVPRRGIAADEVFDQMLNALKKIDFTPVIVLDEFDQLIEKDEASKILYDLLRVSDYQKSRFGLIILSNDSELITKLDSRVKSSLNSQAIEFKPYTPQQLKDILKERCKYAFFDNVLGKDVINVAAAHAAKNNGDARIAIEALLKAGRLAVRENSPKVSVEQLKKAFNLTETRQLQKSFPSLDFNEKILLKILTEKDKINSGDLFEEYKKISKEPLTERSFRSKISRLEKLKLVKTMPVEKGIHGKTRKISLFIEKKELLQKLEQA